MIPTFINLRANYSSQSAVTQNELFQELGWEDLIGKPEYMNTCAIRVSLALIKCGVKLEGRMPVNKGPFKGKLIEPGQAKLANMLTSATLFGEPEKFATSEAERDIGSRQGLLAFWRIPSYMNGNGGHIDILLPSTGVKVCGSGCFWTSSQVWFWEMR